jgi:CheY-like chemotaxis protein
MASSPPEPHLAALRDCRILDTPPEPDFDAIVQRAAAICETPAAAVSLIEGDRCWFKARHGISAPEIPRNAGFCGYAFRSSGTFIVGDALASPRFRHAPLVTMEKGFRFYTGVPLILREGVSIGTLCVLDHVPRELRTDQLTALQQLAGSVVGLLEKRRHSHDASAAPARRGCVLVVDDHADVREFCASLIRRLGLVALQAYNGIEALKMVDDYAGDIRLILSDVQMPGMDGVEFVRALRERDPAGATPIIMMTALTNLELRGTLAGLGVDRLVRKPFAVQELQQLISEQVAARAV